jgi:hypothetical protein
MRRPDADRWLIRPDLDAHVYMIVEALGGTAPTSSRGWSRR